MARLLQTANMIAAITLAGLAMCRWCSVVSHPSNAEWADPYKPRFRSRLQQKSDDKSWQNGPNPDEAMVSGTPPLRLGPLMRVRIRLFSKIQDFASWLPKIARLLQSANSGTCHCRITQTPLNILSRRITVLFSYAA